MFKINENIVTKHFDIQKDICIFEIQMPDGRFLYYEFKPNHKLKDKITWYIQKK